MHKGTPFFFRLYKRFGKITVLLFFLAFAACDAEQLGLEDQGPGPLTPQQKQDFYKFLADVSDLVGSHAMVGNRDRNTQIKLSTRGEQIRGSLEAYGCKFNTTPTAKDYPIGREVTEVIELVGPNCPTYRVQRRSIIVSRSEPNRNQSVTNGAVDFIFKPNYGLLTLMEFQSAYGVSQGNNPKGGVKNNYSSSGTGTLTYAGGKYSFKMGNEVQRHTHKAGANQQISWWEFNMGSFTAVIEQDKSTCRLNSAELSAGECATMITNLREALDSVTSL